MSAKRLLHIFASIKYSEFIDGKKKYCEFAKD